MSQKRNFIYKLLEIPIVYSTFQTLVGTDKCRRTVVSKYLLSSSSDLSILDIGCGTGETLDVLPEGIDYTGVDIQPEYIEKAKKRYGGRGKFYCLDINNINEISLNKYDVILGFGFLHHLDDDEVTRLMKNISKYLKPGGFFLSLENAITPDQSALSRFIVLKDRGNHIRKPEQYRALLGKEFKSISTNVYHNLMRIPYTCVVNVCKV